MHKKNRATLRNYFKAGNLPTEEHFYDLIDSTLNMVDEGFKKSPEHGFEISALGSTNALLSFYSQGDPNTVQWSLVYGPDRGGSSGPRLLFAAPASGGPDPCVMSLDPAGRVGVGNDKPQHALDVSGTVRSGGRIGCFKPAPENGTAEQASDGKGYEESPVAADGEWHDISGWLEGCQAFEVVAGTGEKGKGRYALLHAVALNTFNPSRRLFDFISPRKTVRATEAYYSRRCDRLELRWDGTSGKDARYRLQIRSRCPYSKGVLIQYFVTRLWFDPAMDGAAAKSP